MLLLFSPGAPVKRSALTPAEEMGEGSLKKPRLQRQFNFVSINFRTCMECQLLVWQIDMTSYLGLGAIFLGGLLFM